MNLSSQARAVIQVGTLPLGKKTRRRLPDVREKHPLMLSVEPEFTSRPGQDSPQGLSGQGRGAPRSESGH